MCHDELLAPAGGCKACRTVGLAASCCPLKKIGGCSFRMVRLQAWKLAFEGCSVCKEIQLPWHQLMRMYPSSSCFFVQHQMASGEAWVAMILQLSHRLGSLPLTTSLVCIYRYRSQLTTATTAAAATDAASTLHTPYCLNPPSKCAAFLRKNFLARASIGKLSVRDLRI